MAVLDKSYAKDDSAVRWSLLAARRPTVRKGRNWKSAVGSAAVIPLLYFTISKKEEEKAEEDKKATDKKGESGFDKAGITVKSFVILYNLGKGPYFGMIG